jgi:hypothetical protein
MAEINVDVLEAVLIEQVGKHAAEDIFVAYDEAMVSRSADERVEG